MTSSTGDQFRVENPFSLRGKTALVTGGSSGLGLIMSKGLLQNGVKVLIASRNAEKSKGARKELNPHGECYAFNADVTSMEDRKALLEEAKEKLGSIAILINNAGTNWGAKLEEYPDQGFAKVISTNLNAVFSLTCDALPLLEKAASFKDPARIINIGSMDGIHVPIVQRVPTFAYSSSKAALHHLTKSLAIDLAPKHITVNAVAPGFFESRMTDYLFEHYKHDIEDDCPLHRVGEPEDLVGIIAYLASRAGAYTNGTVIPVDGGTSISKGKRSWQD